MKIKKILYKVKEKIIKAKEKTFNWAAKDKKIIFASFVLGLFFSSAITYSAVYSEEIQKGIAGEVLRFHVIANSDSEEDQKLKLKVRDGILSKYRGELEKCRNVSETKEFFTEKEDEVISFAEEIIRKEGFDYKVKAYIGESVFPTKRYGDILLPAGKYEALKIEIGNSGGKNWWCVMFPPLCFTDVSYGEDMEESKDGLKNILTEEEYGIVAKADKDMSFKVKFKIVELWEEIFSK